MSHRIIVTGSMKFAALAAALLAAQSTEVVPTHDMPEPKQPWLPDSYNGKAQWKQEQNRYRRKK